MRTFLHKTSIGLASVLFATLAQAQADPEWEVVTDTTELSMLITGKALAARHWNYYFRRDGKLASKVYDSTTVREWSITDNGEICYAVFAMADKIIRCEKIERTTTSPLRYRMIGNTGKFEFEITDPPTELINTIIDRAGPE